MSNTQLLWEILKTNNRYVIKRNGTTFTRDPFCLTNKNNYHDSGIVKSKAVGVISSGKNVQVITLNPKNANKPAKSISVNEFNGGKGNRGILKSTKNILKTGGFTDKQENHAVLVRVNALAQAQKIDSGKKKVKDAKKGRSKSRK